MWSKESRLALLERLPTPSRGVDASADRSVAVEIELDPAESLAGLGYYVASCLKAHVAVARVVEEARAPDPVLERETV